MTTLGGRDGIDRADVDGSTRARASSSYGRSGKQGKKKTDGCWLVGLGWDARTARQAVTESAEIIATISKTNGMGGNACRAYRKIAMTAALASDALLSNALARTCQSLQTRRSLFRHRPTRTDARSDAHSTRRQSTTQSSRQEAAREDQRAAWPPGYYYRMPSHCTACRHIVVSMY